MGDLHIMGFNELNPDDHFFDSLKEDYPEFSQWFNKKSVNNEKATVYFDNGVLKDFLYLKIETDGLLNKDGFYPELPPRKRLKIGTFKIESRGTKRGDRFIKRIMDIGVANNVDEIYVTIFPKHANLIKIFNNYGFIESAHKIHHNRSEEKVLIRDMRSHKDDILLDYPFVHTNNKNKYILSIYPEYHSKLFPDSILNNESKYDLIKDLSATNSIHKLYVCFMKKVQTINPGDIVIIYRTTDIPGKAFYRSVVTSICVIEDILTKDNFRNGNNFVEEVSRYSVFTRDELLSWYNRKTDLYVIKMTYNVALTKRLTRGYLIDQLGMQEDAYWGLMKITDKQFMEIYKYGKANEDYFID